MKKTILLVATVATTFLSAQSWNLTGNAGTTPSTNFLGTTDASDFVLKTNGAERMRVNAAGNVAVGGVPSDPNVGFQVFGRTQLISNVNSDGVQIRNMAPNISSGMDMLWLTYDNFQPNDVGLLTLSSPPTPNAGDFSKPQFSVRANGKVFMGVRLSFTPTCSDCNEYRLFVQDGIRTEKIKVDIAASNGWADYVFKKDYKLMPLNELDQFINENGHLPEVPSTEEAIEKGIELKEMNILLLKKVEELTLHMIDQNKQLKAQNEEIQALKKEINASK
ncbi:hypothetical protein SAMN05421664_0560 [Chryseobacterium soldanellicola]|uniref:Cell wall anchor protein n=1 Tax=Chryseobacterium soldanellicola TaxID=311333 RepID=A0A1H0Y8G2_9FLAO|nr:AAA family ATPase [Chryseobacterium soldanellicola]SDQ11479.1 hypothetical protein SAMN05421664_0560 [Chryseobacterium soldanellicola]